jgi:hypothetical protein
VLLRFYVLLRKTNSFVRARLVCNQRGLQFDDKLGVLVDVNHRVSVWLSRSVNFFAMYSLSSSKIFVFTMRTVGDNGDQDGGEDGVVLKLMRCVVLEAHVLDQCLIRVLDFWGGKWG